MDLMNDTGGELGDGVSAYLRSRGYLSEFSKFDDLSDNEYAIAGVIEATQARNEASTPHVIFDLHAAEHQFNLFKNWTLSLPQEQTRTEFSQVLAPLLCHLYLDCLPRHKYDECLSFIRRFSGLLSSPEWCPFWEELSRCSSLRDLSEFPMTRAFRDCKIEIRMRPQSLQLLKRYLCKKDCRILIQVLQAWFKAVILTDDVDSEDDGDKQVIQSEEDEADDLVYEENTGSEISIRKTKAEFCEDDPELSNLLVVVSNKRASTTPPPPLLMFTAHNTNGVVCGRVSDDNILAATGDQRSEVRVWSVDETEFKPRSEQSKASSVPISVRLPPVATEETGSVDTGHSNEKRMWPLRGHSSTVYDVSFVSSPDYLLSVSFDTTMRLWQLSDLSCSAVYRGHDAPIWGLAVSPILNMVATASHDKTARLWSLERTFPLRILAGHTDDVTCVAFHPNGGYLATGSSDRTVRFWSTTDGDLARVLGGSESLGQVDALAFSPCGQYLASSGDDQFVWLWDLSAGKAVCQLESHSSRIVSLDWSLDGNSITACTFDGYIFLWPLEALKKPEDDIIPIKYPTNCSTMLSVRYSNKNSLVAVGLSSDS